MDVDTALKQMWHIADKPERLRTFDLISREIGITDPKVFWSNFWSIFQSSESIFADHTFMRPLIERGCKLGSPLLGLDDEEVEELQAMPDRFTVWRGALDINRKGWSWTVDRDKAVFFANRAYGARERYVIKGTVEKANVLAYLTGRSESEIVIAPEHVLDVTVDEMFEVESTGAQALYHAIQTGREGDTKMHKARAQMTVAQMSAPYPMKSINDMLKFASWAGLERAKYLRALKSEIKKKIAGKSNNPFDTLSNYGM